MVNTICAEEIYHIICKKDNSNTTTPEYFEVKPEQSLCSITLKQLNNQPIEKINITYIPVNNGISTTGHKLQGKFCII